MTGAKCENQVKDLSEPVAMRQQAEVERSRRQGFLEELLDRLDAQHGPVDEALVEKYTRLLA